MPGGFSVDGTGDAVVLELAMGQTGTPDAVNVQVISSPAGSTAPVAVSGLPDLADRYEELQQALVASATATGEVLHEAEQPVRKLGAELFAVLLGEPEISAVYRSSVALAAGAGQRLRIALRIDQPELAELPWEAMYDEAAGTYICRRFQFVRRVAVASAPAEIGGNPPLRILGVVSSPAGLAPIGVDAERQALEHALAGPINAGLVKVAWAPAATWGCLQDQLLGGRWDVLHFSGHGDLDPGQGQGVLALTTADGRADLVGAHRFADLLAQATPVPRLVVLNSGSGAVTGGHDLFGSTATALVRAGVNAVAAMQFEISPAASAAFTQGFYLAIAHGLGVDDAVLSGRVAILGMSSRTMEWLTPVLYLRGDQVRLLSRPAATSHAAGGQVPPPSLRLAERLASPVSAEQFWLVRTLTGHAGGVLGVAFNPDSLLLATGGADRTVRLWDVVAGTVNRELTGHRERVRAVVFTRNRDLASASEDGTARIWDVPSGALLRILSSQAGSTSVPAVAVSPDGTVLATASADRTVRLWDLGSGTWLRTMRGHGDQVRSVAFCPGRELLASAGDDGTVRLWDPGTGAMKRVVAIHLGPVRAVGCSPDGDLIASAGDDQLIRLTRLTGTGEARPLAGHTGSVRAVAFSPDGELLASAGDDRTIRLWQIATGVCRRVLAGHSGSVRSLAFSPDGRLLASGSDDQTVRLWE